jgi:hypothetical protein
MQKQITWLEEEVTSYLEGNINLLLIESPTGA